MYTMASIFWVWGGSLYLKVIISLLHVIWIFSIRFHHWWADDLWRGLTMRCLCDARKIREIMKTGQPADCPVKLCVLLSYVQSIEVPDSKVHGANMGPTWGRQDPGGPHVGLMNLVIWGYHGLSATSQVFICNRCLEYIHYCRLIILIIGNNGFIFSNQYNVDLKYVYTLICENKETFIWLAR